MAGTAVLSVRIRRELKEEVERLGIDVRRVVEEALEREVLRVRLERFRELVGKALNSMNVTVEEWVKAVRESREGR